MATQTKVLKHFPRWVFLLCIAIYALVFILLSNKLLFTESPLSVIFDNTQPDEIFNLLISLWMIAWLLESLLEVIVNISYVQQDGVSERGTRRFTYGVGFLLGLLVALAGVRTLDIFFSPEDTAKLAQVQLFNFMDIVLTAGVLAAGSDGIHQITRTFRSLVLFVKGASDTAPMAVESGQAKTEANEVTVTSPG